MVVSNNAVNLDRGANYRETSSVRTPLDRNLGVIRDTLHPFPHAAHPTSHILLSWLLSSSIHCPGVGTHHSWPGWEHSLPAASDLSHPPCGCSQVQLYSPSFSEEVPLIILGPKPPIHTRHFL